jgi:hypothetical protein
MTMTSTPRRRERSGVTGEHLSYEMGFWNRAADIYGSQ